MRYSHDLNRRLRIPPQTSVLHVRVDNHLKARTADVLAGVGLTLSDAARILPTRVAAEGGLSACLTTNPSAYDAWFRAKVTEALEDAGPFIPRDQAIEEAQTLTATKRRAKS